MGLHQYSMKNQEQDNITCVQKQQINQENIGKTKNTPNT